MRILANTYGSALQTRTSIVLVIQNSFRVIDPLQVVIITITLLQVDHRVSFNNLLRTVFQRWRSYCKLVRRGDGSTPCSYQRVHLLAKKDGSQSGRSVAMVYRKSYTLSLQLEPLILVISSKARNSKTVGAIAILAWSSTASSCAFNTEASTVESQDLISSRSSSQPIAPPPWPSAHPPWPLAPLLWPSLSSPPPPEAPAGS